MRLPVLFIIASFLPCMLYAQPDSPEHEKATVNFFVPEITPFECQNPLLGLTFAYFDLAGIGLIVSEALHPIKDPGAGIPTLLGASIIALNRLIAYPVNSIASKSCLDKPRRNAPVPNDMYHLGIQFYIGSGFAGNGSFGVQGRWGKHSLLAELYLVLSSTQLNDSGYVDDDGYVDERYYSGAYRYAILTTPMSRLQIGMRLVGIHQSEMDTGNTSIQYLAQPEVVLEITQFKRFPIAVGFGYHVWQTDTHRVEYPWDLRFEVHGLFLEKD